MGEVNSVGSLAIVESGDRGEDLPETLVNRGGQDCRCFRGVVTLGPSKGGQEQDEVGGKGTAR